MPKENHSQTIGLTFGLPNSANNGIDIKAGIIDSNPNSSQNHNHKIYDYNDKNKGIATLQSLSFCIDCSSLESYFLTSTNSIPNETNEKSIDNNTNNINANLFSYQDSAIKAQETINDDGTSTLAIESKQDIFAYQGKTADLLMSGISGIFASMAELAKKYGIDERTIKEAKALGKKIPIPLARRVSAIIFQTEGASISLTYNYGNNGKDMARAMVSVGIELGVGHLVGLAIGAVTATLSAPVWVPVAISAIVAVGISMSLNTQTIRDFIDKSQDFTSNVIDKITSWVDEFDVNGLIIQGSHSNGEIQYNPSHPYANPQRNLDSKDYQSLIELLLHKDSNANDIDALLRTFPNYLVNPTNQNNKNDSTKSNIVISNASNAICMNIKAQCFNHKNEILANKEIYVYSPNFNAFVDRAKSDNNGFIEFNNACVSSKMTNSDLYFVLNRYGLDEEQKDFHIKISPSKTIQPKDKKAKQLIGQKLIFDKHIPKAIESNDAITPNIKVVSIEFIQDNQTNSPPNNNAFGNSQKSKYFIALKANYNIRDSQKKHIQGDKDKYLNDSIATHQHKTQWGYIVFDKNEDIDKSLMEITKTTPLMYSKRFKRLENIKGQRIRFPFRDEWEDKQVRFFAYLWRPSKNVGTDIKNTVKFLSLHKASGRVIAIDIAQRNVDFTVLSKHSKPYESKLLKSWATTKNHITTDDTVPISLQTFEIINRKDMSKNPLIYVALDKLIDDYKIYKDNFPQDYYVEFGKYISEKSIKFHLSAYENYFIRQTNIEHIINYAIGFWCRYFNDEREEWHYGGVAVFHLYENYVSKYKGDENGFDKVNHFLHSARLCFMNNTISSLVIGHIVEIGDWLKQKSGLEGTGFDKGDIKANKQGIKYGNELRLRYGRL